MLALPDPGSLAQRFFLSTLPAHRWLVQGLGRVRVRVVPDAKAQTLEDFITDTCEPGATIFTDGHKGYNHLDQLGYEHEVTNQAQSADPVHIAMPAVHRVASLFKRWLLGTHQGGLAEQHLDAYLDEFVFRFNRRKSRRRGLLFYRLLELCVNSPPKTLDTIVRSRRAQRSTRRGPKPKPKRTTRKAP